MMGCVMIWVANKTENAVIAVNPTLITEGKGLAIVIT